MTLCSDLAEMCAHREVVLVHGERITLSLGPNRLAVGDGGWMVIDWTAERAGRRFVDRSSYAAARRAFTLLGDDARRVIGPVVARWRYECLFPLGSSLEWSPTPLGNPSPHHTPSLVAGGERNCHRRRLTVSVAALLASTPVINPPSPDHFP